MTNSIVAKKSVENEDRQAPPKLLAIEFSNGEAEAHADVRWITSSDRFLRIVFTDGSEKWINSKLIDNVFLTVVPVTSVEPDATIGL